MSINKYRANPTARYGRELFDEWMLCIGNHQTKIKGLGMKKNELKKKTTESQVRKSTTCLLVVTHSPMRKTNGKVMRQQRHFFTPKKNYNYLIEFAKAFAADIYLVKATNVTVLLMSDLIKAFCNPSYDEQAEYTIIDDLTPRENAKLAVSDRKYNAIQKNIRYQLLSGRAVNVRELKQRIGVSESTIRRHLTVVRNNLRVEGHNIKQPKRGYYQVQLGASINL